VGVVVGRWWDKGSSSEPLARVKPAWGAAAACAWALAIAGGAWAQSRTLDADSRRAFELHKAGDPHALDELRAAIARHPASDYLELLAATEALKTADPSGLKHLNRALLLHPNNWQAHRLAARELAALGRPAQAAIEYRLAIESGMGVYYDELWSVLHARVLDAVPQHSSELILLGGWLAQQGKVREADLACQRAVEVATRPESAARDRLHVAVVGGDKATVARAAQALLALRPEPAAWSQAAEALAGAGDAAAAMAAARAGMAVYPDEAQLVLTAARLAYQGNDLQSARDLLKRADDGSATLADRQLAAELLAQVADKAGDVDAAVLARARARLLARKLKDSGPSRVY
ncbi:MAG TPA: hypothetical protein VFF06_17765, partial [Polyangia bacterium]|nr:hypothetical protein [Polyangia bacterium]